MSIGGWVLVGAAVIAAIMFLRLIKLYLTIITYKQYWKRQASKTPPEGSFILAVIGDSIAQGIGASTVNKGLVGLVAKSISKHLKKPVHVINFSVTGARVDAILSKQIPELKALKIKPDLLLVEAGANNVKNYQEKQFRTDYLKLLSALPKSAIVLDVPYFGGKAEVCVKKINDFIHPELEKQGFTMAPVHKSIYLKRSRRNIGADFFHPNNRGYRAWYAGLWPVVAKRLDFKEVARRKSLLPF